MAAADSGSWNQPRRLYVAEFKSGVVKVGITTMPGQRRGNQLRHKGASAIRVHYCDEHNCGYWAERKLIARMGRIGRALSGREFFVGVRFEAAVILANQITQQARGIDSAEEAIVYVASREKLVVNNVQVFDFYPDRRGQAFVAAQRAIEQAAQSRVEGADESFDSLNSHGPQFCPREPLNTTQLIGEAL